MILLLSPGYLYGLEYQIMNLKQEAAKKAATLVRDHTIVGLGAGSTIAHVVEFLMPEIKNGLNILFATSSFSTAQLLLKNDLPFRPVAALERVDIYLDGCDQLDPALNALKSGGGIHTQEKLLASMAGEFIVIGDASKLVEKFDGGFPLTIEVLPQAVRYVPSRIERSFPGSSNAYRISEKTDGYVLTVNGNFLLDVWFGKWPELAFVHSLLKDIAGIVDTSLFYGLAHRAIIASEERVLVLERKK